MSKHEPKIRIETREELLYLLAEAAAIEHNLMCCYLYAAWSLKQNELDGLTSEEVKAVKRWKTAILSIAIEEMAHLTLAGNLTCAIGGSPHLSRPNFPIPPGYHPSGVVVELARFCRASLDHFIFLERPEGKEIQDSPDFVHPQNYKRTQFKGRLMPSAQDYLTVGHLYRGIRHGLVSLSHLLGEKVLFCGDPQSQLGPDDVPLAGISIVTDLKSAERAIDTIIDQGEGAPGHRDDSHYSRFLEVRNEFDRLLSINPSFEPAFPVARNPVMRRPIDPHDRVFIDAPEAAEVLDLANAVYGQMLRCLSQSYGRGSSDTEGKHLYAAVATDLMTVMTPVAEYLATLPASADHPGIHAGVTFTMLRDVAKLPPGSSENFFMAERIFDLAKHARLLFEKSHPLAGLPKRLDQIAGKIKIWDVAVSENAAPISSSAEDVPPARDKIEIAEGHDILVRFDRTRCIHARFCVLGAPEVFKANTPGKWIFPDTMPAEALIRVIQNCPSGAITYEPKDPRESEGAPPVNLVNVRENGPYAFRGQLQISGSIAGHRATLCRCGASRKKPFCDGSHAAIGFKASGEPESRVSQPLPERDGRLEIEPQLDGPLLVSGNLEICSGTGRTLDRLTRTKLCRCGGSRSKPFCDGTHQKLGFKTDGK